MKHYILLAGLVLSLGACQKPDSNEDVAPATIFAAFDQDFSLEYRQQALLPTAGQPELTVELADLQYFMCPKKGTCCFPPFVDPTLRVTDAQRQVQQVKMPVNRARAYNPAFIDTTSVRANGRRYLVQYTSWNVKEINRDNAEKQDISVLLRVSKPSTN